MKRVFEAQRDGVKIKIVPTLSPPYDLEFAKGGLIILEDNKIDGWKLLPRNEEIKKK